MNDPRSTRLAEFNYEVTGKALFFAIQAALLAGATPEDIQHCVQSAVQATAREVLS